MEFQISNVNSKPLNKVNKENVWNAFEKLIITKPCLVTVIDLVQILLFLLFSP